MADRNYLIKNNIRVAKMARLIAKAIDLFIVTILTFFLYPIGILFAVAYMIVSDSIQEGQSVGKRFIGFAVISLEDGRPCSIKQSAIRNLPIIIPLSLAIIPFAGWLFSFLVGLPLIALEIYLLYHLDSGHRLGDVMADTSVVASTKDAIPVNGKKAPGIVESK